MLNPACGQTNRPCRNAYVRRAFSESGHHHRIAGRIGRVEGTNNILFAVNFPHGRSGIDHMM
jgi:hypothetical protein